MTTRTLRSRGTAATALLSLVALTFAACGGGDDEAAEPSELDPDADLTDVLLDTGCGVLQLLRWEDRDLADVFAGTAPAPSGPWRMAEWVDTDHGPRLAHAGTWATLEVESDVATGWSRLVTCVLREVVVGDDVDPLVHRRGRYLPPGD